MKWFIPRNTNPGNGLPMNVDVWKLIGNMNSGSMSRLRYPGRGRGRGGRYGAGRGRGRGYLEYASLPFAAPSQQYQSYGPHRQQSFPPQETIRAPTMNMSKNIYFLKDKY